MNSNKNFKKSSWGARYILLILSRINIGLIDKLVNNLTVSELVNKSYLSEKSVSNHIKELKELDLIDVERDLIFGKGRGVNTYKLYEKFDSRSTGLHNLIIERILFISNMPPIQKFILIILISEADDFGIVKGLGYSQLMKLSGISRNALKTNLRELINNDFIFEYAAGGNLPIFLGKIKGTFYVNFIRYKENDLLHNKWNNTSIDYSVLEVSQRFNIGFKFIDFNVHEYFKNIKDQELNEYFNSLTEHSYSVFFNIIISTVHLYSGALLTELQRLTHQKDKDVNSIISELKKHAFDIGMAGSIINVDLTKLRDLLKSIRGFKWGQIHVDIKNELFKNFTTVDNLDKIRRRIYSEIIFLINYYAFRTHFQLINTSSHLNKYTIVRDFRNRKDQDKDFQPSMLLLQVRNLAIY